MEEQVEIPMELVMKKLRAKLEEANWTITLLESRIEMMKREAADTAPEPPQE